jgi:hypothetical protein
VKQFSKFVGMDVHKATIAVSVADANGGEVRYVGEIANTPEAIEKLVRQLRKGDAHLSFCYWQVHADTGFTVSSAISAGIARLLRRR